MIPYFDYRPEYRRLRPRIDAAIARVLESGQLILGPEVEAFEGEIASSVGVSGAVGVASGTDALILALRALGIGAGDEVITVANAGAPPVAAIRAAGAFPRFVDVDPAALLLDPERLSDALTAKTRCVLPVHLYGQPAPLGPILEFARRHGLAVVEDCAQAQGALYDGRPVGARGQVGCFSFYPTKNLGAFGDGGMCVTDDPAVAERLRMLRMYGFRGDRHSHCEGLNSRLDELQAAILRVKLAHLDSTLARRAELASSYRERLQGSSLRLPETAPQGTHSYHLFVVRTPDRGRVVGALERASIGYGIHYPVAAHRMQAYGHLRETAEILPVTERACEEVLSLPLYEGLDDGSVDTVVRALRSA